MTRTKLASVGFVAARNCIRQQVLDDTKSLPNCGRSQSATTCDSSYTPNSAQYYSILQRIQHDQSVLQSTTLYYTPVLLCTTKFYSVLQSPVPLCTTKQYSGLGSATPVLLYTTPVLLCTTRYYSSTTLYYKVLLHVYSVLQVLPQYYSGLWTTKYYSSTTLYYKEYSVLQRILCTTKYHSSTTKYYCSTPPVLLRYYSESFKVLQSTTPYYKPPAPLQHHPVPQSATPCYTTKYYCVRKSLT